MLYVITGKVYQQFKLTHTIFVRHTKFHKNYDLCVSHHLNETPANQVLYFVEISRTPLSYKNAACERAHTTHLTGYQSAFSR